MPQFPINSSQIFENVIIVKDTQTYHHLTRSLRVRINEQLKFIDENENVYKAEISEINAKELKAKILSCEKSFRKLNFNLTLAQGVLHSDAQNFLIQKAAELGVTTVIPIITDNCAVKKEVADKKLEKWEKIAFEAFKQCERANVPNIEKITTLKEIDYSKFDKIIVCSEIERTKTYKMCDIKNAQNILLIVGVEGGFSKDEFEFFKSQNFDMITLGNLILKAETAVISAISQLIYERQYG